MSVNSTNVLNNLQVSMLMEWNNVSNVIRLTRGSKLMSDISSLNVGLPMNSEAVEVLEVRSSFIGDDELNAIIDQQIGLTASSVTYSLFPIGSDPVTFYRAGTVVFSTVRQYQAVVIAASAGQITLSPVPGVTLAQVQSAFTSNSTVYSLGIHVANRNSSGVPSLNYMPEIQLNYLSTMREGHDWNRVDFVKSRINVVRGKYWTDVNITSAVYRMLKDIERNYMFSVPSANPATDFYRMGGIDWCIRHRGGVVSQFAAAPTKADFVDWLSTVYKRKLDNNNPKILYIGSRLYNHINDNFGQGFIQQIDVSAPRTGQIDMNMDVVKMGGYEVLLRKNVSILEDPEWDYVPTAATGLQGSKKEWTAYLIDTDPVMTKNAGELPALRKVHFKDSPFFAAIGKGIGDAPLPLSLDNANILPSQLSADVMSMQDNTTIQFMFHGGIDMPTGFYSAIFEPSL